MPGIGSRPVPKIITRYSDRRRRKLAEDAEMRETYRKVDARDGTSTCRCCGRRCKQGGGCTHDHLRPRSLATKVDKHTVRNVYHCCRECNLLIKAGKIRIIGTNAEKPMAWSWTTLATPKERRFGMHIPHEFRLRDERVRRLTQRKKGQMDGENTTPNTPSTENTTSAPTEAQDTAPAASSQGDGGGHTAEDRSVADDRGRDHVEPNEDPGDEDDDEDDALTVSRR